MSVDQFSTTAIFPSGGASTTVNALL